MIILDTTTRSLQFVLLSAVSVNQLQFSASYVDITTTGFTPATNTGVSNNTTAVTLAASPAAATQRQIKNVSIFNADTVAATVIVKYNDNGTLRIMMQALLQPNETLQFNAEQGWFVLDIYGARKANTSPVGITLAGAKQTTVNFGVNPVSDLSTTVIDPAVTTQTPILASQHGGPTPDKSQAADENEMDPILFIAAPAAGQFTLYGAPLAGPVVGQYKANYIILPGLAVAPTVGPNSLSIAPTAWYNAPKSFLATPNGTEVALWPDLSAFGNNAVARGSAGNRPIVIQNANLAGAAIQNQNSKLGLQPSAFAGGISNPNSFSIFAIVYFTPQNVSTFGYFAGLFKADDGAFWGINKTTNQLHDSTRNSEALTAGSILLNTWYSIVIVETGGGQATVYVNGNSYGSIGNMGGGTIINIGLLENGGTRTIPVETEANSGMDGMMAELAIYNGQLTPTDIALLHTYAQQTYGLP